MLRLLQVTEQGHIPYGKKARVYLDQRDSSPRVYLNNNRQYDRP